MPATPQDAGGYHVSQLELGIGDILCALYGLNGFSAARNRPQITLHLRDHFGWIELVDIPNLRVAAYDERLSPPMDVRLGDTEEEYREKLRGNHDPKQWYARKLGSAPVPPPLNQRLYAQPPPFRRPYVVLAPYATRVNRTWEIHNWRIVAEALKSAGYGVIALDSPNQPERCKAVGVEYFWGQPPAWTAKVCRHAALIVSNDSALAHVGGLLGVPTLVLLSQQTPEKYFSMTANHFLVPQQPCVNCRFQPDRGYEERCDFGCWTLQSISPITVAQRALALLQPAGI